MKHLILAITLVALIATTIIACKSTGTPTGSGYSSKDRGGHNGRVGYRPSEGR